MLVCPLGDLLLATGRRERGLQFNQGKTCWCWSYWGQNIKGLMKLLIAAQIWSPPPTGPGADSASGVHSQGGCQCSCRPGHLTIERTAFPNRRNLYSFCKLPISMEESFFLNERWWNEIYLPQENGSREHLKIAQQYFQLVFFQIARLYLIVQIQVGGSASECDTIPGRQCMAACFFLLKQFDDVLLYLNRLAADRL